MWAVVPFSILNIAHPVAGRKGFWKKSGSRAQICVFLRAENSAVRFWGVLSGTDSPPKILLPDSQRNFPPPDRLYFQQSAAGYYKADKKTVKRALAIPALSLSGFLKI